MWCWQKPEWPNFTYAINNLKSFEDAFIKESGISIGAYTHISDEDKAQIKIQLLSEEAVKTSQIEGEILDRDSIQASICRNFGLSSDNRRVPPAEKGISALMFDLYSSYSAPLTSQKLFNWHQQLMAGRTDLQQIGEYRQTKEPTQIVSGRLYDPKIHYEAPPSSMVEKEMNVFIRWFNDTAPNGKKPLPALTRAGIAHLYFVLIHPFEDGNGRIARAIAEMSLAQNLCQPTLIALAYTIEKNRKNYYSSLGKTNKTCEITDWLIYFAKLALEAQNNTLLRIKFVIEKNRLLRKLQNQLNPRQLKVLNRMFEEGIEGFKGGLSAENYLSISKTTRSTASRDLQDLVKKGALVKIGELRYTRYFLNISVVNSQI